MSQPNATVVADQEQQFNVLNNISSKIKHRFQDEPEFHKQFLAVFQRLLLEPAPRIVVEEADPAAKALSNGSKDGKHMPITLKKLQHSLKAISRDDIDTKGIRIENCVGFTQVPVGLAGPLSINGRYQQQTVYAPLATTEPTIIAACSRGCKALQTTGGVGAIALSEGMSRAPVFGFLTIEDAIKFYEYVPCLESSFRASAESTSRYAQLIGLVPHIIGKTVHVKFIFTCGDAAGQNMVTIATHCACINWMTSDAANGFRIVDFQLDGQLSSDKKLSWGNVHDPRGVQVQAWGTISNAVCQKVLGCTTSRFHEVFLRANEGGIRNGQMGQNANTANIMAAMFIACGQDVASVLECGWSHLTIELDRSSQQLTLSLYFPSLAVGTVGGGTQYPTQREALELIGCFGPGKKNALAETIAAFALALEVSSFGAIANDTFAKSHANLARSGQPRL